MKPDFVLAYDASCGPCSRFKALVSFLDARKRLRFISLEAADESGMLDRMAPDARYGSFHLIVRASGSTAGLSSGSLAILPLARVLFPSFAATSRALERLPASKSVLSFAYSTVSRLHHACSSRLVAGSQATARR
jgi:predicted DCC family thiol-disulfide oxidoreductase YuxK